MRSALATALAFGLLAGSSAAGNVDPGSLVIGSADVPRGYVLSRSESGLRSNQREASASPEVGRLFRRWGRVTGYQRIFERGERTIESRADVFRSPAGPHAMLRWADHQVQLSGVRGLRRTSARIGEEGLAVEAGAEVYVYWRYRHVWAALGGWGLAKARALALARLQQRRIVSALG